MGTFEDELAKLNEHYFFREFTYSKNTFRPEPSRQVELADSLVWIGSTLLVYQLKEREVLTDTTVEAEKLWYEKKVLGQGTRQIRDTLRYLKDTESIEIANHRGDAFKLDTRSVEKPHKIIVYLPHAMLPVTDRNRKYHKSRTAGVIHLFPASDYLDIVRTLLTPPEVADYLVFREGLIDKWAAEIASVPEWALLGQYLSDDFDAAPSLGFGEYLRRLEHEADEWDMSGIISQFPDRITTANKPTDYYPIVREIALLTRSELREFKQRFQLSMEKARANEFDLPYRMVSPSTNCGFIFNPVIKDLLTHRTIALQNFTEAHKYDRKLSKCVGVSIAEDTDGWFIIDWCYIEYPWEHDVFMENLLQDNFLFRPVKEVELSRYTFSDE